MPHDALGLNRILGVGLAAGLLMNVLGWIGNQVLLGPLWKDAVQAIVPLRSRTWVNEVVSLVPDFMYGIAIAWLFAVLAETRGRTLGTALRASIVVWAISVVPTYLGIANSALLPVELAVATTLVGLASALPTAWFVWKWFHRQAPGFE